MEKEKDIKEKGDNMTVYEVSYLLLPSLSPEQVPHETSSIKEGIISRGGAIITHEDPILIDLAYSMTKVVSTVRHKVTTGYLGWVKFEIAKDTPEADGGIIEIKKLLDGNNNVLRYLIIKTVRENTLLSGKMMLKKEEKIKRNEDVSPEVVESEKETIADDVDKSIDKSIEDLVIV